MRLQLHFPPEPEYAAEHAALAVDIIQKNSGTLLDYSPESLEILDQIVESFRQQGMKSEDYGDVLFIFGCYVGEVLVRNAGGAWRRAEETPMRDLSCFMVVQLAEERFSNPIGKVFKRLDLGDSEYLPYFYSVMTRNVT